MSKTARPRIELSAHAIDSLAARRIKEKWVQETIYTPTYREADPKYPGRFRAYGPICEAEGRILLYVAGHYRILR